MRHPDYRLRTFINDRTGGLLYHWRAARYRRSLWRPFLECVEGWIRGWEPQEQELVMVGPSAGYTLPPWFARWASARFRRVTALEPDLLARHLLQWRLHNLRLHFGELDCFAGLKGPEHLARAYPHAAFLFSNVIGQLVEYVGGMAWRNALSISMRGRSWASYHDVVSTRIAPRLYLPAGRAIAGEIENVMAEFWPRGELPLRDHETFRLLPQSQYAVWSITPEQHHLIEWVETCSSRSSREEGITGIGGKS